MAAEAHRSRVLLVEDEFLLCDMLSEALAADALRLAEDARNQRNRAAWLRLARAWLDLLPKRSTAQVAFDNELKSRGTGQDSSQRSH